MSRSVTSNTGLGYGVRSRVAEADRIGRLVADRLGNELPQLRSFTWTARRLTTQDGAYSPKRLRIRPPGPARRSNNGYVEARRPSSSGRLPVAWKMTRRAISTAWSAKRS
ncbi:MAG: hypothetical protein QOE41_2068 [Mycobacterium sp.]|jgi:hypothetical protein|nr:hypothetical protein [Mycobacterium sp.]